MALNKEDKGDVKKAMGAAMANKVSKVTRDKKKPKLGGVVLGMYDRDFSKPFNKKEADATNKDYFKRTGKYLSNIVEPKSAKSKALQGKSGFREVKSADDVKKLHGGKTDTYSFRK